MLVADNPRGPFKAFAKRPLTPPGWQCLDGILLFEMEEKEGKLSIINEATGNWYKNAKGRAKNWVYTKDYTDEPVFSENPSIKGL